MEAENRPIQANAWPVLLAGQNTHKIAILMKMNSTIYMGDRLATRIKVSQCHSRLMTAIIIIMGLVCNTGVKPASYSYLWFVSDSVFCNDQLPVAAYRISSRGNKHRRSIFNKLIYHTELVIDRTFLLTDSGLLRSTVCCICIDPKVFVLKKKTTILTATSHRLWTSCWFFAL